MATNTELQILAIGALAEVGDLSPEDREKVLEKAFYEGREAQPAGFLGLDFARWRKDAEVSLYKGICKSNDAFKKLSEAAGLGETDAVKYLAK